MLKYNKPSMVSEKSFENSALACGKTTNPPPGSYHFMDGSATFTGHAGPAFGGSESISGGSGHSQLYVPGNSSDSISFSGLCLDWVTYSS